MKISLNQIKQFLDFDLPSVDELVKRIGAQLGEVEEILNFGDKYKDALIVKVVECEKHPDADRLSVTKIDDRGKTSDIPRDERGLIQVVCGAPNVHADMMAVWLPPKSVVPASYDDKEPFVLSTRELRGVLSQGMLAAPDELAIGTDHEGIIEITESDVTDFQELTMEKLVGESFAEVFGLDDTTIDIENKMFTHRPDCFGQLGVAREIAGILGHKFKSPNWYLNVPNFKQVDSLKLEVFNDTTEKVPKFMAVAMKDIKVEPSPLWLQCALVTMGAKPINNVVDITNYIMLITAQPTHAYDYDKLRGHKLGTRMAKKGEKATLLNGKEYEFDENDIVIADGDGIVGLAGIMGGLDSEVTSETKNIVLECANFDMYSVRKSSMRHGLFTDALTRFNKGQSPLQNDRVMKKLIKLISDFTDAKVASEVFDEKFFTDEYDDNFNGKYTPSNIDITPKFINDRLGIELSDDNICEHLNNVEMKSYIPEDINDSRLCIQAPFWRTDIEIPEDIVEEVGRLYGYDKLPLELPRRSIKPANKNQLIDLKQQIREILSKAGANEVLTYSFIHEKLLKNVGQNPENAFKLSNALSPDLQYYRLSLLPSLLDKVHANLKAGVGEFAIFENGKAHIVGQNDDDGLPREDDLTALVITANDKLGKSSSAYYQAKKFLTNLVSVQLNYRPIPEEMRGFDITKPFDAKRSSAVYADETFIGVIGEFRAEVRRNLKLPKYTAGFELDTRALVGLIGASDYRPLPKFPKITQDITLQVGVDVSYDRLADLVQAELDNNKPGNSLISLEPISIYQSNDDKARKNISFRLEIASYDRTLTDQEVAKLLDSISAEAKKILQADRA